MPQDRMGLRVEFGNFQNQISWLLSHGWKIRQVRDLVSSKVGASKEVAISFDDGYLDQLAAAHFFYDRGLRVTFFRITGLLDKSLNGAGCYKELKVMGMNAWEELQAQGHEIGGHSHRHPGPLTLQPFGVIQDEIAMCYRCLRPRTGQKKIGFSYPHGACSPVIQNAVKKAGFFYACGSRPGPVSPVSNRYWLPRVEISGRDNLDEFKRKVEGRGEIWRILRHDLMRGIWKIQGRN